MPGLSQLIFGEFPDSVLEVDDTLRVLNCNAAALALSGGDYPPANHPRIGALIRCVNAAANACGNSHECRFCILKDSVLRACNGVRSAHRPTCLRLHEGRLGPITKLNVLVSAFRLAGDVGAVLILQQSITASPIILFLRICSWCRGVSDGEGYWRPQATIGDDELLPWISLRWTHGICPDCRARMMADHSSQVGAGSGAEARLGGEVKLNSVER